MIASLQGEITYIGNDHLVIVVGGVGLEIYTPHPTSYHLQDKIFLFARLVAREDSLTLYGFDTSQERELFDILIKINGIGPRLGITILSILSMDNLRNAIATERAEILTRVPGIGKKTAQKILLELKDKIPVGLEAMPESGFDSVNSEVMDALLALGYSVVEAQVAIQSIPLDAPNDVEERLRLSLQYFSTAGVRR